MESGRERKRGMEQSTSSSSSLFASATEDEIIVAQILLDLKRIFSLPAPLPCSNWGCRRKRSCLEAQPPNALARHPPPPENRIEAKRLRIRTAQAAAAAAAEEFVGAACSGDSPNTPLSFSPILYDEKPLHSLKESSKKGGRRKEELLDMVEELTRCKELLTRHLEKVKKYYDELITCNSQLRAKKQEVLKSRERNQHHQINPPLAADQNSIQSDDGLGSVDQGGPRDFDLNIPAEESFGVEVYQPLDVVGAVADKRARFAEARRNRVEIIKTMSNRRSLFKHY